MATIKYEAPTSVATLLSTELNGLANGANKITAAISNDAAGELYLYADFELVIASTASRSSPTRVDMYILIELDGSNYSEGSDTVDPAENMWVGSFIALPGTLSNGLHIRGVELPPTDFKVLLVNNLGVAMAATLNTLKWAKYNLQSI